MYEIDARAKLQKNAGTYAPLYFFAGAPIMFKREDRALQENAR